MSRAGDSRTIANEQSTEGIGRFFSSLLVGGILKVAGLPEFLGNASEAAASFNDRLVDLAALAEAVVAQGGPYTVVPTQEVQL